MRTNFMKTIANTCKVLGFVMIMSSLSSCLKNSAKPILQVPDTGATEIDSGNGTGSTIEPGVNVGVVPQAGENPSTTNPTPTNPGTVVPDTQSNSVDDWDGLSHDIGSGLTIE